MLLRRQTIGSHRRGGGAARCGVVTLALLAILASGVSGCGPAPVSGAEPPPTAEPTGTRMLVPTSPPMPTPTPSPEPTSTETPTLGPTPSATRDLRALRSFSETISRPEGSGTASETPTPTALPTTLPIDLWNDVPIMEGAWGSRDIDGTYAYTVQASLSEVLAYYEGVMVDLGWRRTSELSDGSEFAMLVFEKGTVNVGVSVSAVGSARSFVTLGLY